MTDPMGEQPVSRRPLRIEWPRTGAVRVARFSGSCTMEQSALVAEELTPVAIDAAVRVVVLDLGDLDFVESSGLGGVIAAYLKCRKRGGEFRIAAPQPNIRRVLKITRLDQLFPIFDTVEAALADSHP